MEINIDDLDADQSQPQPQPEKPLKEWRTKFEAGTLEISMLMQYFSVASPHFFTLEQISPEPKDLGM